MNDAEHLAHLEAHVAEHIPMLASALGRMETAELQRILDAVSRDRKRLQRELNEPITTSDRVEAAQARLSWTVAVGYLVGEELQLRENCRATRIPGFY